MNNRKNMRIGVLSLGGMLFLLLSSWNNGVGAKLDWITWTATLTGSRADFELDLVGLNFKLQLLG